ncbi:MAG: Hsp20/alpha crystallin family protein [Bacteroidetes bacterium]|nr:Hsp20/alpha crystallin family protein [Bacteroidota bacterium]
MRTLMLNRDFVSPFLRMARDLDNLDYGCNHNNLLNPLYHSDILNHKFDIYEDEKAVFLVADMPGIKKEDISINVTKNRLTIKAEKKDYEKVDKKTFHLSERVFGKFERSFELPNYIDTENIKADYESGVLTLTMNKKAETQPKMIEVSVK